MADLLSAPPENGQDLILRAALALAGYRPPVLFTHGENAGGAIVSGAIASFVMHFSSHNTSRDMLDAAEHIGWRYLVRIGDRGSVAAPLADKDAAFPDLPTFLQDAELGDAIIRAGIAAEPTIKARPKLAFQARLLKLHRAPESWLWIHADGDKEGDSDFIVSLDGDAVVRSPGEMQMLWLEAGIPEAPIGADEREGEAGG